MLSQPLAPLMAFRRFVTYALIPHPEKPGKMIKRPTDVVTGLYCKAIDPAHQYSYAEAVATGRPVGFVIHEDDGFFFLDIDGAYDGVQWSPLAVDLCNRLAGCAFETSQSHTGLHFIGRGIVPKHGCRNIPLSLELYTHDRFVALTDLKAGGDCMFDATAAITQLAIDFFPPPAIGDIVGWTDEPVPEWDGPKTDAELLEVALKSGKNSIAANFGANHVSFADLWNANEEALSKRWPGDKGAWDGSAVDAALASHLAFWTGKNCERIRNLMMQSALTRDKWEDRPDYIETTIMKACAVVKNVATGRPAPAVDGVCGDWDNPDLSIVDGPEIPAPPFPRDLLGEFWSRWCADAAEGANAPFDYVAMGLLTVVSALIGNARIVAATETWKQPAVIWTAIVGGPSAGKSPALAPLTTIIARIEQSLATDYERTELEYRSALQIAKAHEEAWLEQMKAEIKNRGEPTQMPADCVAPEPPVRPRVFITDATMEATGTIAAGNLKGLLMYREELAGWWLDFNRYNGGGERKFWIEGYDARPYTIDRKSNRKPIIIPRLALCILGGVQPDALNQMLASEQDGFSARFVFVFPEPEAGFELKHKSADMEGAERALRRIHSLELVDDGDLPPFPYCCRLTLGAATYFESWWREVRNEAMLTIGPFGQWLGKQGGMALRLSLILEHLWWSYPANSTISTSSFPKEVSESAVRAATRLIDEWSAPMAQRVFGSATSSYVERNAAALAKWLCLKGMEKFNARTVQRERGGCPIVNNNDMHAACDELVKYGILRYVGGRQGETKGRNRRDYEVNPRLSEV